VSGENGPADTPPWHPTDADDLAEREAIQTDASTPLPDPGTPERERLDREQAETVAGLLAASRPRLPASWTDTAITPQRGQVCACCQGRAWWGDDLGWRCGTCHPRPDGYRAEGMVVQLWT